MSIRGQGRGRGEQYTPRGRGEIRGRGEQYPSRGRGEAYPPRGRGETYAPRGRGRGTHYPPQEIAPTLEKTYLINRESVKNFFGTRNNVTYEEAKIKEGVNYTMETLSYMTPHVRADEITGEIVQRMPIKPFIVFECCAGIGGNTLSFLDNPNVSAVYAYEINPQRRQMLLNNIKAYHLEAKAQVDGEFTGVPPDFGGCCLYLDPPWLPSEIPGHVSTPEQYPRQGLRVGAFTLEEWLGRSRHCALVAMRVPPEYQLQPVEGFVYQTLDLRKSRLILCQSQVGMGIALAQYPVKEEVRAEEQFNEKEWLQGLHQFVEGILRNIVPEDQLSTYLSEEAMKIWGQAFTHESFNTNVNYEELEILGDAVLQLTFKRYLMRRVQGITKNQISAMLDRYNSKLFQRNLAQNLGIGQWVRTYDLQVNIHILEDVFESFFGALFSISDEVIAEGLGYINCYNLLTFIYNDVELNLAYAYGRSKTQIKEFFERLGWGIAVENTLETNVGTRVIISLTPVAQNYLAERGIVVPRDIGGAEATTKKVATHEAYDNALANLARYGITREWVAREKEEREFSNPDLLPYVEPARVRLRKEGYERMFFFSPRAGVNVKGCLVQLIGVKPNGEQVRLESVPSCDPISGRVEALRRYAQGE